MGSPIQGPGGGSIKDMQDAFPCPLRMVSSLATVSTTTPAPPGVLLTWLAHFDLESIVDLVGIMIRNNSDSIPFCRKLS